MDFGTNVSDVTAIALPEETTRASAATPGVHDKAAGEREARLLASHVPQRRPDIGNSVLEGNLSEILGILPLGVEANSVPQSALALWTRIGRANMSVRMFGDLMRIAAQPNGWRGPASVALRAASLKGFLDFWADIRGQAKEPELSLVPDGSLLAEWYKSEKQRLDVRFVKHTVLFGLLADDRILEGAEQLQTVAQILKSHQLKPLNWSSR